MHKSASQPCAKLRHSSLKATACDGFTAAAKKKLAHCNIKRQICPGVRQCFTFSTGTTAFTFPGTQPKSAAIAPKTTGRDHCCRACPSSGAARPADGARRRHRAESTHREKSGINRPGRRKKSRFRAAFCVFRVDDSCFRRSGQSVSAFNRGSVSMLWPQAPKVRLGDGQDVAIASCSAATPVSVPGRRNPFIVWRAGAASPFRNESSDQVRRWRRRGECPSLHRAGCAKRPEGRACPSNRNGLRQKPT